MRCTFAASIRVGGESVKRIRPRRQARSLGTLYVVATPIGNLEDISTRALRVLSEVSLIAAEDTRHTGQLLAHFGISTPQLSYHAFNESTRRDRLLESLAGGDVALVTDAGTPGISDPGVALVDAALKGGFEVRSVAGPSSLTAALSVSGLIDGPFVFLGFLPRKGQERSATIGKAGSAGYGLVLYEPANRLEGTLRDLSRSMSGRRFAVVRELSKIHEEITRGVLDPTESFDRYAEVRGEIVIVIEAARVTNVADDDPIIVLTSLIAAGMKPSDAAREAASLTGQPRSELYKLAIAITKSQLEPGPSTLPCQVVQGSCSGPCMNARDIGSTAADKESP